MLSKYIAMKIATICQLLSLSQAVKFETHNPELISKRYKHLNNKGSFSGWIPSPSLLFTIPRGGSTTILPKSSDDTNSIIINNTDTSSLNASPLQSQFHPKQQQDQQQSHLLTEQEVPQVIKRDGRIEPLSRHKIETRLSHLASTLASQQQQHHISIPTLTTSIFLGTYPNMTTSEIDTLASETAASMSTQHYDYTRLAARICATSIHKTTCKTFSQAMEVLYDDGNGFISPKLYQFIQRHKEVIDSRIEKERDYDFSYFGFKTLERSYLLKTESGRIVETPQYMWMRVALGIHCCSATHDDDKDEEILLQEALETYDLMSRGYFTHASPTLFHSGTICPQLSSCFLVQMSDDSINGIYDTLKRCAVISKSAGGIGLSVHNIRASGTYIKGTRGVSNGLVPMLRVYDVTSRYVDQGGGKRPGAFAIYIEPWHADIFDVLNLKKNHGKEEQRARDLFYGLWVPDLFMKRVKEDAMWSLMCPHVCKGLQNCHGEEFDRLYVEMEKKGKYVRQVRARELWSAILDAQIETGTPYLLFKDAANAKSNQQNLGTIQCSNLCTEIIQYTDEEEVAVCNLASICLAKFVVSNRGPYGSVDPESGSAYFDHEALHETTKIVTRNLNKIIDINMYPIPGAAKSNLRHRPMGIGVSGLADVFLRLGLPFTSDKAKELNEAIFETIYHAALEASTELAVKEGPYETFSGSPASKGLLQFNLWGINDAETPSHRIMQNNEHARNSVTNEDDEKIDHNNTAMLSIHKYSTTTVEKKGYDWDKLRMKIINVGLRNSLLVAPMPTASTSQILGVNECFEPFVSNMYLRRSNAGEFIVTNPHLLQDLSDHGLWNPTVRNQLMHDNGSVSKISGIPDHMKELYKTVWELKMKDIIDMAAARGKFIDQSQSLNLFVADPTTDKLTAMHFYAWQKGLKTGMYYLRTKPAVSAIKYTVDKSDESTSSEYSNNELPLHDAENICLSCSA